LQLWDVASGQEKTTLRVESGIHAAWFSPDGTLVGAGTSQGETVQLEVSSGKQLRVADSPFDLQSADLVQWSSDGRLLCLVRQTQVRTFEALTGRENPPWGGTNDRVEQLAVSPNNKMLALGVRAPKRITGPRKGTRPPAETSGPGALVLVEVLTGQERAFLKSVPSGMSHLTFSPDGRWLVFAATDTIHAVDLRTGEELQQLHGDQ